MFTPQRADVFIERASLSVFHPKFHLYRRVDVSSRERPLSHAICFRLRRNARDLRSNLADSIQSFPQDGG